MTGMGETASLPNAEHKDHGQQRVPGNNFNAQHDCQYALNINPVNN